MLYTAVSLGEFLQGRRNYHEIEVPGLPEVQFKWKQLQENWESIHTFTGSAGHVKVECHWTSKELYIFYGKENDNRQSGTRFSMHEGMISTLTEVEFVPNQMSWKPEANRLLVWPRHKWKDNIVMDLTERG